ncbi:ABC-F family ATP-binding cassette domain-containing protein [Alkalicoccus halolimnae]|uniref:ABC-F family ATP-binding cassette domain-containing protein n=1 Tax=Alkalicoccus halolimnae TaxID=1667239 RepID=A0A5C7F699_9BACI|nr:ABC-F family ATP-binding cassette domain-containing protein [Alkalicoccus halolimnae]TXF85090.1 ABC-F family ATP-binding cassette domain-containing protein [Alkalicoccus halolimnae]
MSLLRAENLVKTYGDKVLFNRISFTVEKKERIGLVGINGTGKSSLLKAVAGIDGLEGGDIIHANDFRMEYVPQDPFLEEELTVLETVFYGDAPSMVAMREYEKTLADLTEASADAKMQDRFSRAQAKMDQQNAWEANTQAKVILTKLGIQEFQKPVGELSGGQRRRVSLARALIQPADLLLLDEPTNHLDNVTIEWLEGFLKQYSGALIVITHDRYFLNRVTQKIFEMHEGNMYEFVGNYERFLEQKAERERTEIQQESKRQNILRRELAWLKRGAKARSTKQKARKQRVEALQDEEGPSEKRELDFAIGSKRLGKNVIELEDVSVSRGGEKVISGLSYLINRRDRLGIIGPNGTGKTTLLHLLAGKIVQDSGSVHIGETVKIGYYTQEHEPLDENLRMIDYIKETAEAVKTADGALITAEQMLERFLFSRAKQWTHIRRLSGGERKRLYLLKVLMEEPNVLFLDEPTNDLDTETLSILEDYLDQFPGVVITVSHDRYFLDRAVSQLLVFREKGGNIERYYGSYSEWLEEEAYQPYIQEENTEEKPVKDKTKRKKLSYKDQQEWNSIEEDISKLEEKIEQLDEKIEATGADFDKAKEFYEEKQETEKSLEKKMERWEELSLLVEE